MLQKTKTITVFVSLAKAEPNAFSTHEILKIKKIKKEFTENEWKTFRSLAESKVHSSRLLKPFVHQTVVEKKNLYKKLKTLTWLYYFNESIAL